MWIQDPGWEKIGSGMEKVGSGINILDPQDPQHSQLANSSSLIIPAAKGFASYGSTPL
jgi:hypothetical protein